MSAIKLQKNQLKKMIGYIAAAISLVFIVRIFLGMEVDILSLLKQPRVYLLILLFAIITVIQYCTQAYAWTLLLRFTSHVNVTYFDVMTVYLKANIAKYIPGNVMHFAGRNLLGTKMGISQVDMALSTVAEIILMALSAGVIVVFLAWNSLVAVAAMILETPAYRYTMITVLLIGILLACVCVVVLYKKPKLWKKYRVFFSREFVRSFLVCIGIYAVNFFIYGLIFLFIFLFILQIPVTPSYYLPTISMTVVAWLAGHLIPGVPGGIGIRESISTLVMSPMFGADLAALASVVLRIISILSDVLGFLATFSSARINNRREVQ